MFTLAILFTVTSVTAAGGGDLWVESPVARIWPDSAPSKGVSREVRLWAARGESESAQICLRAGEEPLDIASIDAQGLGKDIPPPECRWVGFVQLPTKPAADSEHPAAGAPAQGPRDIWPDPLLDFAPLTLAPNQTCALWVTYRVPRTAHPGSYRGKISLVPPQGKPKTVAVNLVVFDFEIPEHPSLRTAFTLDRQAICKSYGIGDTDLDAWRPIYDALANTRISYRLWDGGSLVTINQDGSQADAKAFKQHLEYAVTKANMNAIDIGASEKGANLFPSPESGSLQDPVQFYLHDMAGWLQEHDWLPYAFLEPATVRERAGWQDVRDACFRVKRNDDRIKRLLVAAPHPFFERYADLWAMPLRHFDANADALFRAGRSLIVPQPWPATNVTASSSGNIPGLDGVDTQATDGYDGCLFTYWLSAKPPSESQPQSLQIALAKEVKTNTISLIWRCGFEATAIRVFVPKNNHWSALPNVKWEEFPPTVPYTQSWATATLESEAAFSSVRFEFRQTNGGAPVGVTEVLFGTPPEVEPEQTNVVEPWLASYGDDFPSFRVDADPIEARLMPWVCFGHRAGGFVCGGLNHWPAEWAKLVQAPPSLYVARDAGNGFLFYPGREAPIPSIRSELLRDGMEDYEYLLALDKAIAEDYKPAQPFKHLAAPHFYPPMRIREEIERLARAILKERTKLGYVLSSNAKKGRP